MINQVKTSAAGKLMLLGEHAVVYGYPCLVTAINKKITVSIKKIPSQDIQLNSPIAPKSVYDAASVSKFFQKYKFQLFFEYFAIIFEQNLIFQARR